MTIKQFLRTIIFSLLSVSTVSVYAMFDNTYDYYNQLGLEINVPQAHIQRAFTKKIAPYFKKLVPKENYKGNTLLDRLIAYDNIHGELPLLHKIYKKDKKAFDVLNDPVQRKAYDIHKGYDAPEPKAPIDYHDNWCTGYCKKYNHKIHAVDKEKLIGQKMPLKCGHKICVLCTRFDPIHGNGNEFQSHRCPFEMQLPDCNCSVCPRKLEEHLVANHKIDCPKCHIPIANAAEMRQELMQHMSFKDHMLYMLPPELRPFATKWHLGLVLTGILTAKYVSYFHQKAQLQNQFETLEHAADNSVTSLLSFEFEQFDDVTVLGLKERFDIEKIIACLKSEELKASLISKIARFDTVLQKVYDVICARYYYNTVDVFLKKESTLVASLNASLIALKEAITVSRAALDIKKTTISPRIKSIAGLCIGSVTGLYIWSNIGN